MTCGKNTLKIVVLKNRKDNYAGVVFDLTQDQDNCDCNGDTNK